MRFDEVIPEAGRPIAYYPRLRQVTGSTNATLLLCQLIYWTGKKRDPHGWIFKSAEDLTAETGLSYEEQKVARAKLRGRCLITEIQRRLDHIIAFHVNAPVLRAAISALTEPTGSVVKQGKATSANKALPRSPTGESHVREQGDATSANKGKPCSLNGTSEITPENTAENTSQTGATNLQKTDLPSSWNLAHGLPVSEEQLQREREGDRATAESESALGVANWPWASTRAWEKLVALLTKAWKEDAQIFRQYAEWAEGEGRFKAMSVKQIRLNPQQFIDTGWPLFVSGPQAEGGAKGPGGERLGA